MATPCPGATSDRLADQPAVLAEALSHQVLRLRGGARPIIGRCRLSGCCT
jgi:hypothetical protein